MAESVTCLERIVLMRLLQGAKGTVESMRAVDKFATSVEFGKKEQEALKDMQLSLAEPGPVIEVEISPLVKVAIQNVLKDMDKAGALERIHLPLWERFVEGKVPAPSPDGTPKEPVAVG